MPDETIEDSKTERLIASKRHNELKDLLGKLTIALNKKTESKNDEKPDNELPQLIAAQTQSINELVKSILSLPKPEKANVNVEVNNDKLESSIVELNKSILKVLDLQEQTLDELRIMTLPKKTIFDVKRNQYTQTVTSIEAITSYTNINTKRNGVN